MNQHSPQPTFSADMLECLAAWDEDGEVPVESKAKKKPVVVDAESSEASNG